MDSNSSLSPSGSASVLLIFFFFLEVEIINVSIKHCLMIAAVVVLFIFLLQFVVCCFKRNGQQLNQFETVSQLLFSEQCWCEVHSFL